MLGQPIATLVGERHGMIDQWWVSDVKRWELEPRIVYSRRAFRRGWRAYSFAARIDYIL